MLTASAAIIVTDPLAKAILEFRAEFKGSPMKRAKLTGLKRNAAVALGNAPGTADVMAALASRSDSDNPVVREHVQWALARHAGR